MYYLTTFLSMAQKRTYKEAFEVPSLDSIDKPMSNANIHGVITSLSPIKKGRNRNYFDATLSDGTAKLCLVGFNSKQQSTMTDLMQKREPVQLSDCQIKPARRGHDMEVMLKNTTIIHESPKKMSVSSIEFEDNTPATILLDQLQHKSLYELVTVNVKVVRVMEPQLVSTGKRKQDIIISNASSTATVTLWEEHINSLESNCCYSLKGFVIREYNCSKYLAMSFKESEIIPIGDIGEVCPDVDETKTTQIYDATIIGVKDLGSHKICIRCNARVEPTQSNQGRCTKSDCHMLQRYDVCPNQLSATQLHSLPMAKQSRI